MTDKPCHLKGLFIRENGDLFPCCRSAFSDEMIIGNLNDKNLFKKLIDFNKTCSCSGINLVQGTKDDIDYDMFNLELSYLCQATCSMCCVDAPNHPTPYNETFYSKIENLIKELKPKNILVQGGEILVQEDSMRWLESLKTNYPKLTISIITNGNYIKALDKVKKTFDSVCVSIVGFQSETYKNIMGLDIEKTKSFCENIAKCTEINHLALKYLLTPTNVQDLPLFIDWAMSINPNNIIIQDSCLEQYIILNTNDKYWEKTFLRTKKEFTKVIKKRIAQEESSDYKFKIEFYNNSLHYFELDDEYIKSNKFETIVSLLKNNPTVSRPIPTANKERSFSKKIKLLCKSRF